MKPISRIAPLVALAILPLNAADLRQDDVLKDMRRVADWQLANPSSHPITRWTTAPFYLGLVNLYQVSEDARYLEAVEGFGRQAGFGPAERLTHADDHAILQAWLELYRVSHNPQHLRPSIAHFEKLSAELRKQPPLSISGGTFTWCWCDALFMSPPVWFQLSELTGDSKYADFADREWWTTTDVLFDPTENLYYRDNRYFQTRTASGLKTFWARGNGWVVSGLAHSLDYLPADHPSRGKYLALYGRMMEALLRLQNPDGKWRTSLLDVDGARGESSGTAFFAHAMAWGVNRGLLDEAKYRPAIVRAWKALAGGIQPDGMLGYVQSIDEKPDNGATGAQSTEIYGAGAFLLAGSEIIRLLDPAKRRKDLARFDGVKLPAVFHPEPPRTHVRFVPERSDDFAWENDLIAFRTYGPGLRAGAENSGFDAWLKRVPYPVIDKWYKEELTKAPYGNVNKPYHIDHGEGNDPYKVGSSRGCGGISLWVNGALHNSETFLSHRILSQTPEQSVFELYYASDPGGRTVRETKRVTVRLGQRLFQVDSKFTIDGRPAAGQEVAIGLHHQTADSKASFDAAKGILRLWEPVEKLGLGTAIVIRPDTGARFLEHTDADGQRQSLCIARTDAKGHVRWFAGYGWEGQKIITDDAKWSAYLKTFASTHLSKPFVDHRDDPGFIVPDLPLPVAQ